MWNLSVNTRTCSIPTSSSAAPLCVSCASWRSRSCSSPSCLRSGPAWSTVTVMCDGTPSWLFTPSTGTEAYIMLCWLKDQHTSSWWRLFVSGTSNISSQMLRSWSMIFWSTRKMPAVRETLSWCWFTQIRSVAHNWPLTVCRLNLQYRREGLTCSHVNVSQDRALDYLSTCIDQVHTFGDILQLVIVELIYKVGLRSFTSQQTSRRPEELL